MSELQTGMLAMIVGARYAGTQINIGKMVEVISIEPDNQALVKGDSIADQHGGTVDQALCLKIHLLPIKPQCDPLDVTHKEELHA
jgi:hypothetical protein